MKKKRRDVLVRVLLPPQSLQPRVHLPPRARISGSSSSSSLLSSLELSDTKSYEPSIRALGGTKSSFLARGHAFVRVLFPPQRLQPRVHLTPTSGFRKSTHTYCLQHRSLVRIAARCTTYTHLSESSAEACRNNSQSKEKLFRNAQRFKEGLVFKAHRLCYHSTLGLRVMKKK